MNQQKERHELEITKALECCGNPKIKCFECPFMREEPCTEVLLKSALDLINLKNAEIERLNEEAARFAYYFENAVAAKLKPARAEAIKEFSERVGLYWLQFVIDEIREFATKAGLDPVYSFNPTEKELNEKYKEFLECLEQIAKEMGWGE